MYYVYLPQCEYICGQIEKELLTVCPYNLILNFSESLEHWKGKMRRGLCGFHIYIHLCTCDYVF